MTMLMMLMVLANPTQIEARYKAHIQFLADDLLEGRETTQRGQKLAAAYLASQLAAYGVQGAFPDSETPYFQPFDVEVSTLSPENVNLQVSGKVTRTISADRFRLRGRGVGDIARSGEMVFVGYGVRSGDYDDFEDIDMKGRWVLMLAGEPDIKRDISEDDANVWTRLSHIWGSGAIGIIALNEDLEKVTSAQSSYNLPGNTDGRPYFPNIEVKRDEWEQIIGKDNLHKVQKALNKMAKKGKPASFVLKKREANLTGKRTAETRGTENVVAIIPGQDPVLKNEYVVLSAHYDHEGIRDGEVYNGADDNATGTATLLMAAEELAKQERKRSIIILLLTAEEKGLLGSKHFVAHPPVPKEQIVADINVDMIGRSETGSIGLIPAKSDVSTLLEDAQQVNEQTGNTIEFRYDMDRYHTRSDHYNFVKAEIPALFFFTGVHEDYHEPGDDWQKLHYGEMATFFTFFCDFVGHVSNNDKKPSFQSGRSG